MNIIRIVAAALAAIFSAPLHAEPFTNDSIVALAKADVGEAVLLAKVNSLPCGYDVSTAALIRLKGAGVPNRVIAAMVDRCAGSRRAQGSEVNTEDPLVKRMPGLYVDAGQVEHPALRIIRPTVATGVRITGNGSVVFPYMAKLEVPRASAQMMATSASPSFWFYFEPADQKVGDFGSGVTWAAQSPAEFSLIRFKVSGNRREMTLGRAATFNVETSVDAKNSIAFTSSEMGDGIFRVDMAAPLTAGQYAFVLKAAKGNYRIYDFEVR